MYRGVKRSKFGVLDVRKHYKESVLHSCELGCHRAGNIFDVIKFGGCSKCTLTKISRICIDEA